MQSVNGNNKNDPSRQTDDKIDKEQMGGSVCMSSKKQIISQALNAAAKETSSVNSIVDSTEMSEDGGDQRKTDVIDRFFGFAERLICSADNTTNVEIDPKILIAEERKSLLVCGDEDMTDDKTHTKTFVEKILGGEVLPNSKSQTPQAGNESTSLHKKASDDTGSTAADSVDGIRLTVKNKARFWPSLHCCMGKDIEDSVVYTESAQATA